MTSIELAEQLIQIRRAVCVLAGPNGASWWKADFLSNSAVEVAAYNFPRRPVISAFRAAVIAAKRLHDERIGRRGIVHLFRLPVDAERTLQRDYTVEHVGLNAVPAIPNPTAAMDLLHEIAGAVIDPPEGPVQVGYIQDCLTPRGLSEVAAHYHAAFRRQVQVFPYFAAKP
jgi:hypothetical protein